MVTVMVMVWWWWCWWYLFFYTYLPPPQSIFPSCCLGSLLNRNWSKPWIAQYIAIHSGMSFTVKRLLRTAPKWHTSYLYLSPKIKLFHSKIFYFFSFSLFFSSVAVLFFCRRIYLGCLLAPEDVLHDQLVKHLLLDVLHDHLVTHPLLEL